MVEITCLVFEADRKVATVTYEEAKARAQTSNDAVWIHVRHDDPKAVNEVLTVDFGFHPLAVEDAVSKDERPELKEFDDHVFLVAPAVLATQNDDDEMFEEVAFFIKHQLMVTVVDAQVPCLQKLTDRWVNRQAISRTEIGYVLFAILDSILEDYFPRLDDIEEKVDKIGDDIYNGNVDRMRELLVLKHRTLDLRRRLGPFRDVMSSLMRRELEFVTPKLEPYFQDLFDNTLRLTELIDTNREAMMSLIEIQISTVSNNLNQIMKKMTVISTVLMTAALIAGIYGMNFKFIPELDWKLGYPAALLTMVASSFWIVWLFRRKKWL